jgi:hypothetical protein
MSQINQTGKERPNILLRLWRGQLSLPVSYWVFGVLGRLIWVIAIDLLRPNARIETFLLSAGMIGYSIVVYVGIWRAADRYTGRKEWAFLAKCVVVLGVILLVRTFGSSP